MLKVKHCTVYGPKTLLRDLKRLCGLPKRIVDYGPICAFYPTVYEGSEEDLVLQRFVSEHDLDLRFHEVYEADPEELATGELFKLSYAPYIEAGFSGITKVAYTGQGRCPSCGRGTVELAKPIRLHPRILKWPIIRIPPALIIASFEVIELAQQHGWTGFKVHDVIDRQTKAVSSGAFQIEVTSILPPMPPAAPIERSTIPDHCELCHKLGYQYGAIQPIYSREVLDVAQDWNFSTEWLASHYVSCPFLICRRRVVEQLAKLDKRIKWIPIESVQKLSPTETRPETRPATEESNDASAND